MITAEEARNIVEKRLDELVTGCLGFVEYRIRNRAEAGKHDAIICMSDLAKSVGAELPSSVEQEIEQTLRENGFEVENGVVRW